MKTGLTELVFILDKSGSMGGLERDTIGGYNANLTANREVEGECKVTTVLFDTAYTLLHDRVDIKKVKDITEKEYAVGGGTALLDALGRTINSIGRALDGLDEDKRPEKVLFVIVTDGEENSSKEFSAEQVREMVTHQREVYSWEFIFLGANIDAVQTATQYGFAANMAQNYHADHQGSQVLYASVAKAATSFRSGASLDGWNDEIQADYAGRSSGTGL